MRTIIKIAFVAVSLTSVSALACPDLTGNYSYTSGPESHPTVWLLTVTQKGCESVTYVSTRGDDPRAVIRDEKVVGGDCIAYKLDPDAPGDSCYSYRFEGDALLGETFDRGAEGLPYVRASQLKITRAPDGGLTEELFEGQGEDLARTAGWEYSRAP